MLENVESTQKMLKYKKIVYFAHDKMHQNVYAYDPDGHHGLYKGKAIPVPSEIIWCKVSFLGNG